MTDAKGATAPGFQNDDLCEGETYKASFPFYRQTFSFCDEDGPSVSLSWKPGIKWQIDNAYSDGYRCANGIGLVEYTLVSIHRPGRYPTRAMFTRQWIDPDGKKFGRNGLRWTTLSTFKRWIQGFGYDFEVDPDREMARERNERLSFPEIQSLVRESGDG